MPPQNDNTTPEQLERAERAERAELDTKLAEATARAKAKGGRHSVSISGAAYQRLKAFCEANNCSMSGVVERAVASVVSDATPSTESDGDDRADQSSDSPAKTC